MLSGAGAVALPLQAATLPLASNTAPGSDALRDHDDTDRPLGGLDRAQRIHHACAALTADRSDTTHSPLDRVGRGTGRHPRGPWRKRRGARLQARRQLRGRQIVVHRAHEPRDARHDRRGEARAEILIQLVRVTVLARNRGARLRRWYRSSAGSRPKSARSCRPAPQCSRPSRSSSIPPWCRRCAIPRRAMTPGTSELQFAGASTGAAAPGAPPLPAETTTSTPIAVTCARASDSRSDTQPLPPRLRLTMSAGYGIGRHGRAIRVRDRQPAAHSMPAMMSES